MADLPMPDKPNKPETMFQMEAVRTFRIFYSDPPVWLAGHGVPVPVDEMTPVHVKKVLEQITARHRGLACRVVWGMAYLNSRDPRVPGLLRLYYDDPQALLDDTPLVQVLRKAHDQP